MARVIAVNSSEHKGVCKQSLAVGHFSVDVGLQGDAHAGPGHRQVSLLAVESIARMHSAEVQLVPGIFAENLTTEGIVLHALPLGTQLEIGSVILKVTQIGKECHQGCAIREQVGDCVMPREGIFASVVQGGTIFPDDRIIVLS